jgi:tetratricopeptide (TPR) repeat protein
MNTQNMYTLWLRYLIIGGLFLVPFIAFLVSSSLFFPFITTKNFAFRILVEALLAMWGVLVLFDRSYLPKRSWLLTSVAVFVGIIAIADFTGVYPFKSVWSNFERMEGLVSLVHLLAYTIVLASMMKTEKMWSYLMHTSIVASLGMGVYGVVQLFGGAQIHQGGVRLDASLGNATYLAVYMLIHMFITGFYLLRLVDKEGSQVGKTGRFYGLISFYCFAIAFQFFVLYHTATRGALIGLLVGSLVTTGLIAFFEKQKTLIKKVSVGLIATMLVVVGGFLALKNTSFVTNSPVLSRFSSISLSETTTKSRFLIWNMALQGAKERPLLGWGQENFNYVFNKFYSPQMYNQEQWFDRTHDVILDWLIAGGVLGLASYLAMFALIIYYLWFVRRDDGSFNFSLTDRAVLSGLLVAYTVHNIFVFDNLISYILFFTVLAYVAERTGKEWVVTPGASTTLAPNAIYAFIPAIVIAFGFVFYVVNVPAFKANTQLIVALQQQPGGPSQNLSMMKQVIGYDSYGNPEVREQLTQLTMQLVGNAQVSNDDKQHFVKYTADQLEEQINKTPGDTRYLLFYGIYLSQLGGPNAQMYLEKALETSPQKQSIYFEIVSNYLRLQKYDEALASAKKAYNLAPEYSEAVRIYALTAIYDNQAELSAKLLGELPENDRVLDDRFIRAYMTTKHFDRVLALLQDKIAADPNNFQSHIDVAQVYLQMGYKDQAIKEIQTAEILNTSIKAQADAFIEQIKSGKLSQ